MVLVHGSQVIHKQKQVLHKKMQEPHRMAQVHGRQVMVLHMKVHRRKEEHRTLWTFPHWEQKGTGKGARKSQGEGGELLELDVRDEVKDQCEVEGADGKEQENEMEEGWGSREGLYLLQGREAGSQ